MAQEDAVVWPEVEAKLSEQPVAGLKGIDPHHLSVARRNLLALGLLQEINGVTRGGRAVTVLVRRDLRGHERATRDAAARKRLLYTRYLSWSAASGAVPNLIGVAGERVTHGSLLDAAHAGYTLVRPVGGEITELFGAPVPGGSLDNAAYLLTRDELGRPTGAVVVLFEVKNVRHWIYPDSQELFQLLDKGARLQTANPDLLFMPVLVCRRAHYTTFRMAKDLGFFVADARAQFILPRAEAAGDAFTQVQTELGFTDLIRHETAYRHLTRMFERPLVAAAASAAARFKTAAGLFSSQFTELRTASHEGGRSTLMLELRESASEIEWLVGGW